MCSRIVFFADQLKVRVNLQQPKSNEEFVVYFVPSH